MSAPISIEPVSANWGKAEFAHLYRNASAPNDACINGAATDSVTSLEADPPAPSLNTLLSRHAQPSSRAWCLRRQQDIEAVAWFSKAADQAELLDVRVARHARGAGLGWQLLNYTQIQLAAEGVCECFLEVRASNRIAQRLYSRLGWVVCGRRSNYYTTCTGREDAILMALHLTGENK